MQSEFDFIEKIRRKNRVSTVKTGIGDDCAVIAKNSKTDLVITTDLLVEDIDFRSSWTKPELLGHKTLAVSLSDIAAMGATPVWSMLSIGIPRVVWQTDFVKKFYEGYLKLAKKYHIELIGGDVSQTPDKIVFDSIAAGEIRKNKAVLRSQAQAGDLIFVTGELGGARAALKLLENGEVYQTSKQKKLLLRQLAPNPQTKIGQIIGENNLATAMIDLSDGLSSDLAHLCRASGVGAEIFAEKIPADRSLQKSFGDFSEILKGGEDFELLFTVNPKKISRLEKHLKTDEITHIGNITEETDMIRLITGGKSLVLQPEGFRHF